MSTPIDTPSPTGDDLWLEERFRAAAETVAAEGRLQDALDPKLRVVSQGGSAHGHARQWVLVAAAMAVLVMVGALIVVGGNGDDDESPPAAASAPELVVAPSPNANSAATPEPAPPATEPRVSVTTPTSAASTTPASAPPTAAPATAPTGYRLADVDPMLSCPTDTLDNAGKREDGQSAGVWYVKPDGTCIAVKVDVADDMPADATPLDLPNYPGLFATTSDGLQQIYAPAPDQSDGAWIVLTAHADTPATDVVSLVIVPTY